MAVKATEDFEGVAANLPSPPWTQLDPTRALATDGAGFGKGPATVTTAGSPAQAVWTQDVWDPDQYGQVLIASGFSASSGSGPTAVVRGTNVASNPSYYSLTTNGSAISNNLIKVIGGIWTAILDLGNSILWANGDVIRLEVVGSLLTCKQNGVVYASVSDSSLTDGSPGGGVADQNIRIDSWEGGTPEIDTSTVRSRKVATQQLVPDPTAQVVRSRRMANQHRMG